MSSTGDELCKQDQGATFFVMVKGSLKQLGSEVLRYASVVDGLFRTTVESTIPREESSQTDLVNLPDGPSQSAHPNYSDPNIKF